MALPVLDKTWQFTHIADLTSGVEATDVDTLFLNVKNAALAFGSNPLTVIGSSDSVTSNMSGTDLLTGLPAMVHDVDGNAHSWIVLGLPQIAAGAQVCFDFNHVDAKHVDIIVSSTGFSGGDETERPGAADESIILENDSWVGIVKDDDGLGGSLEAHLMLSTDGQCFRVVMGNQGNCGGFLLIDKAKNPVPGWAIPMVSLFRPQGAGFSTLALRLVAFKSQATFKAQGPLGEMSMRMVCESLLSSGASVISSSIAANEITGEYYLLRAALFSITTGQKGRHGELFDLFFWEGFGDNGNVTIPGDGSKQFMTVYNAVFPNDGTEWNMGAPGV